MVEKTKGILGSVLLIYCTIMFPLSVVGLFLRLDLTHSVMGLVFGLAELMIVLLFVFLFLEDWLPMLQKYVITKTEER